MGVGSREWWEWHLTPRGWVPGSKRLDAQQRHLVDPPEDRVRTVRYAKVLRSPFTRIEERSGIMWATDIALVAKLEQQFGSRPETIEF